MEAARRVDQQLAAQSEEEARVMAEYYGLLANVASYSGVGYGIAIYNAGNDILETDPLGGLSVSFDGVVTRDIFVLEQLAKKGISTVVMTSGGYTKQSHQLIAELAKPVIALVN
ncbi:MAG: hypothetical protein GXP19_07785 [Gammaproteobacteria bacterium]|nr:hypothetical protein [Gammaproteobacteria bacterium]